MYQKSIVSLETAGYWRCESGEDSAKSLLVHMEMIDSVDDDSFAPFGPVVARCKSWNLFQIQHIYAKEDALTNRFGETKVMVFARATSTSRQLFDLRSSDNAEIEPRSWSWLP